MISVAVLLQLHGRGTRPHCTAFRVGEQRRAGAAFQRRETRPADVAARGKNQRIRNSGGLSIPVPPELRMHFRSGFPTMEMHQAGG